MKRSKLSVIVIEPSPIVLRGVCSILEAAPQITIAGTYSDTVQFANLPQQKQTADVLIVNPTLIAYEKRGNIKKLFPDTRIVALLYSCVCRETLAQFDDTIEIFDPEAKIIGKLESVVEHSTPSTTLSEQGELSDREKEILVAVAKGLTNKEIGDRHNISAHTVISHRKNISRKTGIKSVSGFVVYALLNNLIEETEIQ